MQVKREEVRWDARKFLQDMQLYQTLEKWFLCIFPSFYTQWEDETVICINVSMFIASN